MSAKQKYTPVRFSHLTSYASIGAVVRGVDDKLMAITDIRYWTDKQNQISSEVIPYVNRVSMALNIDKELRTPPKAQVNDIGEIQGSYIPAVLFPIFAKCKKCGLLHNDPWQKQNKRLSENLLCREEDCDGRLEQITWCAVSNKGHLSEVPWHYLCHEGSKSNCKVDYDAIYLKLVTTSNGKRIVKCTKCGNENYYENVKTHKITGIQPWIYGKTPKLEEDDVIEILEVNNPGVYCPERVNALVIPPESRISKSSIIDKLYNNSKFRREISRVKNKLRKKSLLLDIASNYRCTTDEIEKALEEIVAGYPYFEENITVGELLADEYNAFLTPISDVADDEDFVTVHKGDVFQALKNCKLSTNLNIIISMLEHLVIAERLREIQVFKGFYRINQAENKILVPPDIVGESNWLPAIELFGEGVFFNLNEELLSQWEALDSVIKRADEVLKRYEKAEVNSFYDIEITPRFMLLHTLSHLLIRVLENTAGYPAASLKERIYCSRDRKMAGILIYTSVSDIAGSMGGIVESAEPKEFLKLLDSAFKYAQWCSLDPVCAEHEGQGTGWLNRAACHACSLIPETSCEYGNVFLDRVFIRGNENLNIPNFLDFAGG